MNVADATTKDEIERLIAGDAIVKTVRLELTYDEIEDSIDNIWSVLYTTGYLTKAGEVKLQDSEAYAYRLVIPNKDCLLYTSPSPRDRHKSRIPSSA